MRKSVLILLLMVCFAFLLGVHDCRIVSAEEDGIVITKKMVNSHAAGKEVGKVKKIFIKAGFNNILLVKDRTDDPALNGTVKWVEIDGNMFYSVKDRYPADTEVRIEYWRLNKKKQADSGNADTSAETREIPAQEPPQEPVQEPASDYNAVDFIQDVMSASSQNNMNQAASAINSLANAYDALENDNYGDALIQSAGALYQLSQMEEDEEEDYSVGDYLNLLNSFGNLLGAMGDNE